ncbi:hypothetical protein BD414DRAFT_453082 [Trametes punicea]|nr:hypothetical protein BD414DRAFT_453082 [Trametes punicea]
MPSLQSVGIFIPTSTLIWEPMHIPGVSWYVLEAIFTTPHVRHFRLVGPICHPADQFLPDVGLPPLVPMKSFLYELLDERHQPRTLETEKDVLLLVLDRIHDGLEQLALPSEAAPLDLMYDWNWSMLRELSLRGERPMGSRPFVEMLSKMPRLRVLSLVLAEPAGSQPPPIWPRTSDSSCSLRDLEQLSVTHPQPDDEFYRHLPMSLRRLSLRCWPRYYKHHSILKEFMTEAGIEWTSPILHSSDMLHILQQSKTPSLTHLELEYRADLEDGLLFSHICSSYPLLTVLRIHRYRREGEIEVPVADIAQALSGLINLRLLMIHLDFADLPDVTVLDEDSNFDEYTWPERLSQLRESYATNLCAANIFARALPSLEYVCILVPLRHRLQQWLPFRLVGRNEAGDVPCAEPLGYSGIGEKLHGYSIEKDD